MPVATACPKCQTRYNLPDTSQGKNVRCKKCNSLFLVGASGPGPNPAAKQTPAKGEDKSAGRAAPPPAKKGNGVVIGVLAVAAVLLIGCTGLIGGAAYFFWPSKPEPEVARRDPGAELFNEMSKGLNKDMLVPKIEDGNVVVPNPVKGQPPIKLPDLPIDVAKVPDQVKPPVAEQIPDVFKPDPKVPVEPRRVFKDEQLVNSFALSADGATLVAGIGYHDKGAIKAWDIAGGQEKIAVPLKGSAIHVAITPDGKTVAAIVNEGASTHEVRFFDLAAGTQTSAIKREKFFFRTLAYSPDGKTLAASTVANVNQNPTGFNFREVTTIRLYNAATGQQQKALEDVHRSGLRSMAFTADGKTLFTAGNADTVNGSTAGGEVKAWDLATDTARAVFQGLPSNISNAALSSDAKLVAAAYTILPNRGEAKLWETESGKELRAFNTGGKGASAVALSPDSKLLAVGDWDYKVRCFDVATGKDYGGFAVKSAPKQLAFTPDGKSLLIQETRWVELWDLAAARPLAVPEDRFAKLRRPNENKTPPPVTKVDPPKPAESPKPDPVKPKMEEKPVAKAEPPAKPSMKPDPAPPEAKRKPVPAEADLAAALKLIQDLFKEDYAKSALADKRALADKLSQQAQETKDDPAARFVLLRESRDLYAQSGNLPESLRAVDALTREFEVSGPALKAEVIEKTTPANAADAKAVVEAALPLLDEAIAADDLDAAARITAAALAAARKSQSVPLVGQVQSRSKELDKLKASFEKVQAAREALKKNADDPEANLAVGKHLCFVKGDWDKGLPYLAKGSDEKIKSLAQKDLAIPTDTAKQLELADAWYDLAASQDVKVPLQMRALRWYREAGPQVSGLSKTKVDKRLAELEKIAESRTDRTRIFAEIRRAIAARTVKKWPIVGGGFAQQTFEDIPADGAILVGFRYTTTGNGQYPGVVQPIWLTPKGQVYGKVYGAPERGAVAQEVKAKPGYAVGAVYTRGGGGFDAFKPIFMKMTDTGLDPKDKYDGPHIGGMGGSEGTFGGDGGFIVGLHGKLGNQGKMEAISLVSIAPGPPPDQTTMDAPKPGVPQMQPPAGTGKAGLTRDNVARIQLGMTEAEATAILGKPTSTQTPLKGIRRVFWEPNDKDKKYFLGVFRGGKLTNADHWWRTNDPQGLPDLTGK